jgi:hypothetical protein
MKHNGHQFRRVSNLICIGVMTGRLTLESVASAVEESMKYPERSSQVSRRGKRSSVRHLKNIKKVWDKD